ncbi:hypothetical protein B0H14DRAFT_3701508 [Mycena olivaceomarginata]|nr:hypothetical protein B0H14DRAFT_3701508 [Mycena olivaceomarginata]
MEMFTQSYFAANFHLFLDASWISISALKSSLEARAGDTIMIASPAVPVASARVKREPDPSDASQVLEGGREVIELLSDSDDDDAPSASADLDNLISGGLKKSNTIWLDPHVSAMVREVTTFCFASDARTRVERIEHLSELPTLANEKYAVPREHF